MGTPASPLLSSSQLAALAALGEEHTAKVADVLYRVGDSGHPFIREIPVIVLDKTGPSGRD
jgi:hypothetical protein